LSQITHILTSHARPIAAALLLLFATMAMLSVREKSSTFDEIAHLTGGYSYWSTGDYRLHPENGILPQRWATLPLLLQDIRFPDTDSPNWRNGELWRLGYDFCFQLQNDFDTMLWRARAMIVVLGMALGGVVYAWSRRLFGPVGAMISLVLYAFSPTLLAHSRLVTTDLAVTLAFTVSLGCLWMVLHRVSLPLALASALALGALFVSKLSAVLIVPMALLLVVIRLAIGRPLVVAIGQQRLVLHRGRQLAVLAGVATFHAAVVVLVIWLCYGFRYATFRDAQVTAATRDQMFGGVTIDSLTRDSRLGPLVRFANDYRVLPEPYLHGFAYTVSMSQRRYTFLSGRHGDEGWWYFFPYTVLVKTPLATFAILLAAATVFIHRRNSCPAKHKAPSSRRIRRGLYRTAPLWILLAVFWTAAISSHLNIGQRHILPTYPALFILCGAAGYWLRGRHGYVSWLVLALVVEVCVESVAIHPHYLAYFNQLAGGPKHAYRHLVDSSLDWGQDLPGLRRWLAERQPAAWRGKPVYLSYFGSASPEHYGLDVRRLPGFMEFQPRDLVPLEPGTYSISATMLQGVYSMPRGDWNESAESAYRQLLALVGDWAVREQQEPGLYQRLLNDPNAADELQQWKQTFVAYDEYRLSRLCAYLRLREPDDAVGYSILIYHLDERDLQQAEFGPPADWINMYRQ